MNGKDLKDAFDWHAIFFGQEHWSFLPQVVIKTVLMYIIVVISLRAIGRRGIMQGVFQVVTIIMLGSSAGDPMLYREVGVLPAAIVFVMTVVLYRVSDYYLAKYSLLETYAMGREICFIEDGRFAMGNFKAEELSKDEIFADLRLEGVTHIGQVRSAYMEAKGEISVFFYPDEQVKYGLPILPPINKRRLKEINEAGIYSCGFCGYTSELPATKEHTCDICGNNEWVKSINETRVS